MRHLPNALTLTNLFCGCCALVFTFSGQPVTAAWFTLASFICDYADGMVARAMGLSSALGKELDSLADVISFGAVPGAMIYQLLAQTTCTTFNIAGLNITETGVCYAALPAFVLSAFAGLRLARFNLDTRQAGYFIGLSTPACTVLVLGLVLGARADRFGISDFVHQTWFLYTLVAVLSWMLNNEIPMFGMKIKRFDWRSNALLFLFLGIFCLLVIQLKELALSATILIYIFASILFKNKVVGA